MHLPLEETILIDKSRLYKEAQNYSTVVAFLEQIQSILFGSIPLPKVAASFDSNEAHRPISERTWYGRKKNMLQKKVPPTL